MAVDGQHLYWTNADLANSIGRANLDGTGAVRDFITGASTPTGERAAALRACKKKESKEKRRKCRKRAQTLPL